MKEASHPVSEMSFTLGQFFCGCRWVIMVQGLIQESIERKEGPVYLKYEPMNTIEESKAHNIYDNFCKYVLSNFRYQGQRAQLLSFNAARRPSETVCYFLLNNFLLECTATCTLQFCPSRKTDSKGYKHWKVPIVHKRLKYFDISFAKTSRIWLKSHWKYQRLPEIIMCGVRKFSGPAKKSNVVVRCSRALVASFSNNIVIF